MRTLRALSLLLVAALCSCSETPKLSGPPKPLSAHLIVSDGAPVPGAPEPEVVQLVKIENSDTDKHVTVGNVAGQYVLVCDPTANDSKKSFIPSCLSPQPQEDYLLFREGTKWQVNGAQHPLDINFFTDYSVNYPGGENVALMLAKSKDSSEQYGVYWLSSWTASTPAHQ